VLKVFFPSAMELSVESGTELFSLVSGNIPKQEDVF